MFKRKTSLQIIIALFCLSAVVALWTFGLTTRPSAEGPFTVEHYSYSQPGGSLSTFTLSETPEVDKEFKDWLRTLRPWGISFTSYVPYLVVRSDTTRVNFVGNLVVLSVRDSNEDVWFQVSFKADLDSQKIEDKIRAIFQNQLQK